MIGSRPVAAARFLAGITVLTLPVDARSRYREEFDSELVGLEPLTQVTIAASLLRGSIALRHALKEREMIIATHPATADWRCRLGRHHYISHPDDNPEVRGQSVLECTRCGKHEDGPVGRVLGPSAAALAFPGAG